MPQQLPNRVQRANFGNSFGNREKPNLKQSKKAKAFELFSQGYVPLSQEIKDLDLHPSNRYKYFSEWQSLGKPAESLQRHSQPATVSQKLSGGETIGGLDETKQTRKEATSPEIKEAISQEIPSEEAEPENDLEGKGEGEEANEEQEEATPKEEIEKPTAQESIAGVSEAITPKGKDGKPVGQERKIATTIADDGIKCTVFLSLKTLALFKIASSTQVQLDGGEGLLLGDFLDTCVADFFSGRGKTLGLINTGGK